MTLAEIRPLLIASLIGLATLSAYRNWLQRSGDAPIRIPVRFEREVEPQRVEIRRPRRP